MLSVLIPRLAWIACRTRPRFVGEAKRQLPSSISEGGKEELGDDLSAYAVFDFGEIKSVFNWREL